MRLATFLLVFAVAVFPQDDGKRITPYAGRRLALVIGNKEYAWKPLVNPVKDARAVASALGGAGFADRDIHLVLDARHEELRRSVREFVESVKPGDLAFVYYSGHGVEVKGNNYLLPIDLPADATEGYVEDEAVPAQRILRDLAGQGARVRVLVLDACRDNPLRATKSVGGGLAPMEGRGSLIVFATEAGRTAGDSPGAANSVFTEYLLQGLRMPGVSLDDAMKQVSRGVARATKEQQVPAIYGLLLEDVVLLPGGASTAATLLPPAPIILDGGPRPGQVKINAKDGQRYVWAPPGTFTMGCSPNDNECYDEEKPTHEVAITRGFWMAQTPVTQQAYQLVIGNNPSRFKGPKLPVEQVNWNDAQGYCGAIGGRLPTEAEWEYVARAGDATARYGAIDAVAWYSGNSRRKTQEVGQKQPNGFGLYDMLGNVWEWMADWYGDKYYGMSEKQDPSGPPGGTLRALRGGSWGNVPRLVRVSGRDREEPGGRNAVIGFRCVGE